MKTNSNFSKIFLFITVLLLSYSMANSQTFSSGSSEDNRIPAPLRVTIATYDCIDGGSFGVVYHPILGYVFDTRRYQVAWYDGSGKLISNNSSTNSCVCGTRVTVSVTDIHTGEMVRLAQQFSRCNNEIGDNGPANPDLSNSRQ